MTSKQRAYLKGLAMTMDPIFQFGKNSLTPENTTPMRFTMPMMNPMILRKTQKAGT